MQRMSPVLLACVLAAGCAPVIQLQDGRTLRATDDEFRSHAEAVFRRQNRTLVEIGERSDSVSASDSAAAEALVRAEMQMLEACAPLNQLAIARRDGNSLPKPRLWEVAESVPECDASTREARRLLGPGR